MSPSATPDHGPDAPAATRARTPGWRDPRLWIGVLIVAVSVVVGVRLVGGADESDAVWTVAADLGVGDTVEADDLVARQVRFVEPGDSERYVMVDDTLPDDRQLTRAVGAGEMLPRAALGGEEASEVTEVSFGVLVTDLPPSVASGSVVDVLVAPERGGGGRATPAEEYLSAVPVLEVPGVSAELGGGQETQVVVGVPEDQADRVAEVLGAASSGSVKLVRVG